MQTPCQGIKKVWTYWYANRTASAHIFVAKLLKKAIFAGQAKGPLTEPLLGLDNTIGFTPIS